MQTITRKLSKEEFSVWDELVASSPQASIFHSTVWNQMLHDTAPEKQEWEQFICEKDGVCLGGIILHYPCSGLKRQAAAPLLGYNGPILSANINYQEPYKTVPGYEIILELLKNVKGLTNRITIKNQPEIWDTRAYAYNGWKVETNYTHILACSSPESIWEKMDSTLQEQITTSQYSIKTDITDIQIQKFSQHAAARTSQAGVLEKRIHWMKEKGLCRLVTIIEQDSKELATALFILSKENRTIYMWKVICLTERAESDILPSLIWQSYLSFGSAFERMDLGISANMAVSNVKDRMGCALIPTHIAKYPMDFLHK